MAKWTLGEVNARLKAGKTGVVVCQRGDRLSLRATFPPKPGSSKTNWHQQYLSLGIYGNPAGLQKAEARAREIGGLLAQDKFVWTEFLEPLPIDEQKSDTEAWIAKFEEDYYSRRGRTPTTEQTWKCDYIPAWKLLEGRSLSTEDLIIAVGKTSANTRKRKLMAEKLEALAKFAGLDIDLSAYVGNYSFDKTTPRYIPSDQEIEDVRESLANNLNWQWAYGVMAAYGVRPHEVFFCSISPNYPHILEVSEGKTGPRTTYPYNPQWAADWKLWNIKKPRNNGKTYKDYGDNASRFFRRRKIAFTPYCLRHAWCIRAASKYKIPPTVAAGWAGHNPVIFMKIYNKWITEDQERNVYEESLIHKKQ